MVGIKGNKSGCLDKVLIAAGKHIDRGDGFELLAKEAEIAFNDQLAAAARIPSAPKPIADLDDVVVTTLLAVPIVGSADVPSASLIERLKISDWVRQGQPHIHAKPGGHVCPFCQQKLPEGFARDIGLVFDNAFEEQLQTVRRAETFLRELENECTFFVTTHGPAVRELAGAEKADRIFASLNVALMAASTVLQVKLDRPSNVMDWPHLAAVFESLAALVTDANNTAAERNAIVQHRSKQKTSIVERAWREFARGLVSDKVDEFVKERGRVALATGGLSNARLGHARRSQELRLDLRNLRAQTTSSTKTIDAINDLLRGSQFFSFSLAESTVI